MYRTQVSPHRHGFLVERQYDATDRGTWITIERYFTQHLNEIRKSGQQWMIELALLFMQPSANLPPIEIPIAPSIAYSTFERLERAEAEIAQLNRLLELNSELPRCTLCGGYRIPKGQQGAGTCTFLECKDPLHDNRVERAQESVFEHCERIVTEVSDRQP